MKPYDKKGQRIAVPKKKKSTEVLFSLLIKVKSGMYAR